MALVLAAPYIKEIAFPVLAVPTAATTFAVPAAAVAPAAVPPATALSFSYLDTSPVDFIDSSNFLLESLIKFMKQNKLEV